MAKNAARVLAGLFIFLTLAIDGEKVWSAPGRYTLTVIRTPEDIYNTARAINNLGQVVGSGQTFRGKSYSYLWENGAMTIVSESFGVGVLELVDINNLGQVAFVSRLDGTNRIGIWENGITTVVLEALRASPTAINDNGQIIGFKADEAGNYTGFLWSREQGPLDLGVLPGCRDCIPIAFNEKAEIIGGCSCERPFLWRDGVMHNLNDLTQGMPLPGLPLALESAWAINDKSQILIRQRNEFGHQFSFLWEDGQLTDLGGVFPFPNTRALAINNAGEVVGQLESQGTSAGGHPFIYDPVKGIQDLATLAGLSPGDIHIVSAEDINDLGQIVGVGDGLNGRVSFLLTPLSELPVPEIRFIRADANGDAQQDIAGPVRILLYLFGGIAPSLCLDALDANDDGHVDIADPIGLLAYLLLGGIAPPEPLQACGLDSTEDELGCEEYSPCRE